MKQEKFDAMLTQVAAAYHTTPENIRVRISQALEEGSTCRDPDTAAPWAGIPRAGSTVTLEDFVAYLAETLEQPFLP